MNLNLIVVAYNQEIKNSPVIKAYLESGLSITNIIVVDNSTNLEKKQINQRYCSELTMSYISMNGNVGLSKAYNAAIKNSNLEGKDCWYMIFDQDTIVDKDYFTEVVTSINLEKDVKIHVPIVYSKNGLFSPLKIENNKFLTFDVQPGIYTQLGCINSGIVVHSSVYQEFGLYDEDLFLDLVDYNFFKQIYRRNSELKIKVMNYTLQQNFSGESFNNFNGDLKRFEIYLNDFSMYCKKNNISMFERNLNLIKRCIHLTIAYKKTDFIGTFLTQRRG